MNMVEIKSSLPEISGTKAANVIDLRQQQNTANAIAYAPSDIYSASSANEAVAAKVIAFSINSRFETALPQRMQDTSSQATKLNAVQSAPLFDIDEVVNNVLGFVSSSLAAMANNGASSDDIVYFKSQASEGVNLGIDQAKLELAGISNDTLSKSIDVSHERIIKGIDQLPNDPALYQKIDSNGQSKLNEITISTSNDMRARVDFGAQAFSKSYGDLSDKKVFTTQGSNISFSVSGDLNNEQITKVANIINNTDDLLNTFYRKDMQSAFDRASNLGYSEADILSLSKQAQVSDKFNGAMAYDQIKHLDEFSKKEDLSSPKAVAQYLTRLMGVMEAAKQEFASDDEYNQVINGLVNQMKDVQVPDLVQAINKFHAFNAKFLDND